MPGEAPSRELFADSGWRLRAASELDDDRAVDLSEADEAHLTHPPSRPRLAPWPGFRNESTLALSCAVGGWLAIGLTLLAAVLGEALGGLELLSGFGFGCAVWSFLLWFFGVFMAFLGLGKGHDRGLATVALIASVAFVPVFAFACVACTISLFGFP